MWLCLFCELNEWKWWPITHSHCPVINSCGIQTDGWIHLPGWIISQILIRGSLIWVQDKNIAAIFSDWNMAWQWVIYVTISPWSLGRNQATTLDRRRIINEFVWLLIRESVCFRIKSWTLVSQKKGLQLSLSQYQHDENCWYIIMFP